MIKKYGILFLIVYSSVIGCRQKDNTIIKKFYYPSGKLKSYGHYLNDSIAIDTVFTFFENQTILSKEAYDNTGNAIIAISYYENGNKKEIINYKNGLADSFRYTYNEDGSLKSKFFYVDDVQVGDRYFFGRNNQFVVYNFIDWKRQGINLITYDNTNIIKDVREKIFIDSLKTYIDKSNQSWYNLSLVIANPPYCRSTIKIDYVSYKGLSIKSDSIINEHFFWEKARLTDTLSSITIIGSQYDSVKKKTIFQKLKLSLE
jgi:antitoxin component YwqK of YwqJK toxin-antitoxin module